MAITEAQRTIIAGSHHHYGERPPANKFEAIAEGILHDLHDRRGIKNGFYDIDAATRSEIVATLAGIIEAGMELGMPPLFSSYDEYREWMDANPTIFGAADEYLELPYQYGEPKREYDKSIINKKPAAD